MNPSAEHALAKVPEVTLGFWLIKIAATTLGETGGDAVSMSMNLGYLVATGIFAAVFLAAVIAQARAKAFHPLIDWVTTLADFAAQPPYSALPANAFFVRSSDWPKRRVWRRDCGPSSGL